MQHDECDNFDENKIYLEKIFPLMAQIDLICKANNIPSLLICCSESLHNGAMKHFQMMFNLPKDRPIKDFEECVRRIGGEEVLQDVQGQSELLKTVFDHFQKKLGDEKFQERMQQFSELKLSDIICEFQQDVKSGDFKTRMEKLAKGKLLEIILELQKERETENKSDEKENSNLH